MSDRANLVADETVNQDPNAPQENEPQASATEGNAEVTGAPVNAQADVQPEAVADAAQTNTAQADAVQADTVQADTVQADTVQAEAGEAPTAQNDEPQAEADVRDVEPSGASVSAAASEQSQAENVADAPQATEVAAQADKPGEKPVAADSAEQEGRRVVRILSVGQQVTGTVKRIADFGAFVDIGVGRDGLIHISELSARRVGKVTDVLHEGQEITAWIKKLDRDRNRISLTLIDPGTKTIRDLNKGDIVQGTVTRIMPYGAFVDIGIGRDALLHVREMSQGYVAKPEDVVKVGETIEARIVDLSRRRSRVDLSLKGLRPEPEPEVPAAQAEPEPEPQEEETAPDPYDEIEVLSPMELAFKRAFEAGGGSLPDDRRKRGKQRARNRSIQEEIIARTLESGRK